jgi:hypothetical protein
MSEGPINGWTSHHGGTLWSITCHQDYLSGEDRIPCPPKTLALAPSP